MKFRKLIIYTLAVFILFASSVEANNLDERLKVSEIQYRECLQTLPPKARSSVDNGRSVRLGKNWSQNVRDKVDECLNKKRIMEDDSASVLLKQDLVSLHKAADAENIPAIEQEAEAISFALVDETREKNKDYKMARSVLWHNFLIKLGAKKGGYCYHWAEDFLNRLQSQKFNFFERHWGVHNHGKATENNALIITARGDSIQRGIVYDAWRGRGRPFWLFVSKDKQKWGELFTENEILSKAYTIESE